MLFTEYIRYPKYLVISKAYTVLCLEIVISLTMVRTQNIGQLEQDQYTVLSVYLIEKN